MKVNLTRRMILSSLCQDDISKVKYIKGRMSLIFEYDGQQETTFVTKYINKSKDQQVSPSHSDQDNKVVLTLVQ